MDLARIRARGVSRGGRGWVTNPLRGALWRLMLPYWEQASADVEARFQGERMELPDLAAAVPPLVDAALARTLNRATARLDGLQKDQLALAHRLAAIEEQLAEISRDARDTGTRLDLLDQTSGAVRDLAARHLETDRRLRVVTACLLPSPECDEIDLDRDGLRLAVGPMGKFLVWPQDLIGERVLERQVWEPHVRAAIARYGDGTRAAVDAGAYIGLHTVLLSRHFAEVHAFEPQADIFRLLHANLRLNDCSNVRTYQTALYDREVLMRLAPPEAQDVEVPMRAGGIDYRRLSNAAALMFEAAPEAGPDAVAARPLDALGIGNVGFVKIDAQGADFPILRGARETIRRDRPVIAFEYEQGLGAHHGVTLEAIRAFFDELGYRVETLLEIRPEAQVDYLAVPA